MNKQDYLKKLDANENDTTTRLEYADWLDTHGDHEEADRMRKWPAAKTWLVNKCTQYGAKGERIPEIADPGHKDGVDAIKDKYPWLKDAQPKVVAEEEEYYYYTPISYKKLLELGLEAASNGGYVNFGSNEDLASDLNSNREEFWKNWSIVTGITPEFGDGFPDGYFGCAC